MQPAYSKGAGQINTPALLSSLLLLCLGSLLAVSDQKTERTLVRSPLASGGPGQGKEKFIWLSCGRKPLRWFPLSSTSCYSFPCVVLSHVVLGLVSVISRISGNDEMLPH